MASIDYRNAFFKVLTTVMLICSGYMLSEYFGQSAVVWPASDNLPAVCRYLDPNCLTTDFFTNASSDLNARSPYSVFLSQLTIAAHNGLGGGVAIIQSLLLVTVPALAALIFVNAVATFSSSNPQFKDGAPYWRKLTLASLLALVFVYQLSDNMGRDLSVAWWHPMTFAGSANNFSIMMGLLGGLLLSRRYLVLGSLSVFLSGIFHPAAGLFTIVFACIAFFDLQRPIKMIRFMLAGLVAALLAAMFSKVVFDAGGDLSAKDFVDIYVREGHPWHYLPSRFGSFSDVPWQTSFLINSIGLVSIGILLKYFKNTAWRNAFIALATYVGAVALQYLMVELYPVKIIAALGPSRYTMFGPWFLLMFAGVLLLDRGMEWSWTSRLADFAMRYCARIRWYMLYGAILALLVATVHNIRSTAAIDTSRPGIDLFVDFIHEEMGPEDVIIMPLVAPRVEIPLLTGRAVFVGNGFPFSQLYFREWRERFSAAYGSLDELQKARGANELEQRMDFYRQHGPDDFVEIASSHKLEWVLVESEYADSFHSCDMAFDLDVYELYSVRSLAKCD